MNQTKKLNIGTKYRIFYLTLKYMIQTSNVGANTESSTGTNVGKQMMKKYRNQNQES